MAKEVHREPTGDHHQPCGKPGRTGHVEAPEPAGPVLPEPFEYPGVGIHRPVPITHDGPSYMKQEWGVNGNKALPSCITRGFIARLQQEDHFRWKRTGHVSPPGQLLAQ